ncbi:MAG: hypothetical protein WBA12_00950, partial [Catalinimonas sp.]
SIQLRLAGAVTLHHDDALADDIWSETHPGGRKDYLSDYAPATPLPHPASGVPPALEDKRLTEADTAPARDHFVVIRTWVTFVDWLLLSPDGHRRAQFRYDGGGVERRWVSA